MLGLGLLRAVTASQGSKYALDSKILFIFNLQFIMVDLPSTHQNQCCVSSHTKGSVVPAAGGGNENMQGKPGNTTPVCCR